ncbi:MAG: nitrous oxide reductase family maturation protein NosD [Ignavibacteria bacterium]|nr:nitrous oxide reductase family maturation protein NosD [Ignavibacteria bacterium]
MSGKDIEVCSECNVKTIREAIDLTEDGDRIIIKKGIYREYDLTADRSVEIVGEAGAELDIDFKGGGITLTKDNSAISGLTVKNMTVSYVKDLSAIRIENSKDCRIYNNFLKNTFFGIYLANSSSVEISGNYIEGNADTETSSGNGIHLWKCGGVKIEGNRISGHRDGVYLEFVDSSSVRNNYSEKNLRYGLHFMYSDNNSYTQNIFRDNGAGVAVMFSEFIEMTENSFIQNRGAASFGLLLKDIKRSVISRNSFSENTNGIYMEGCNDLEMMENEFYSNGWALKIMGSCTDNILIRNNFIDNTFDISSNSSRNTNKYSENYWDKYEGYDLNKDGTGDVPYRPVSFYSMLLEKIPDGVILLRSFMVDLLDFTEKAIPVFIPETLADENPRMQMYDYD